MWVKNATIVVEQHFFVSLAKSKQILVAIINTLNLRMPYVLTK